MKIMLQVKDLSKSFAHDGVQTHVLSHVKLELYAHDYTVVMGRSGSGKSTLLYCLSGMDTITAGEIYYQEQPLHQMKEDALAKLRRNDFGFVFQQMHLIDNLTLFENICVPGYLNKKRKVKEVHEEAKHLLEQFGLKSVMYHLPSQVSGGEQQRAAIARGLINHPALLFADEPTGALNSRSGQDILDVLTQINENGQNVLMVTHDIKAAVRATRLLYLEDGNIIGDMRLPSFQVQDHKSRETQILSWLSSMGW